MSKRRRTGGTQRDLGIAGDGKIQTRYSKRYVENYDSIFRKKTKEPNGR